MSESKSLIAYKVFNIEESSKVRTSTCGHAGCTDHLSRPKRIRTLKGLHTGDHTLQKVGDTASVSGTVSMCNRGWHAYTMPQLFASGYLDPYNGSDKVIFKVKLSGVIVRQIDKVCASNIEMLEELTDAQLAPLRAKQAAKKARQEAIWQKRRAAARIKVAARHKQRLERQRAALRLRQAQAKVRKVYMAKLKAALRKVKVA